MKLPFDPYGARNIPTMVGVEVNTLKRLLIAALEVAQDLEAEVGARYPADDPTSVRRRSRETEAARWLQSAIPHEIRQIGHIAEGWERQTWREIGGGE